MEFQRNSLIINFYNKEKKNKKYLNKSGSSAYGFQSKAVKFEH